MDNNKSGFKKSIYVLTLFTGVLGGLSAFQLNPFSLLLKCWIYSQEKSLDYHSFCSNETLLLETDFTSVTTKWSLLNTLSVVTGIASAFLGIISADVLGLTETLLLASTGHLIGQINFASAIFTNSYVHLSISRSIDAFTRGFYFIIVPVMIKEVSQSGWASAIYTIGLNIGQVVMVILGLNQVLGGSSAWSNAAFVASGCILLNIILIVVIKIFFAAENENILKNRSGEKTSSKKFGQMVLKLLRTKSELKVVAFVATIFFVVLGGGGVVALTFYSTNAILKMGFRQV